MPIDIGGNVINNYTARYMIDTGETVPFLSSAKYIYDPAYYRSIGSLGGNTSTVQDALGVGQTSTLLNGAAYSSDGASILLDGVDDEINYTDANTSLELLPDIAWTYYIWVKTTDATGSLNSHFGSGPVTHDFGISGGKLFLYYYYSQWNTATSTGVSVNDGTWRCICWSRPASYTGTMYFYVNGGLDYSFAPAAGQGWRGYRTSSNGRGWNVGYLSGRIGLQVYYWGAQHDAGQVLHFFNSTRKRYGV